MSFGQYLLANGGTFIEDLTVGTFSANTINATTINTVNLNATNINLLGADRVTINSTGSTPLGNVVGNLVGMATRVKSTVDFSGQCQVVLSSAAADSSITFHFDLSTLPAQFVPAASFGSVYDLACVVNLYSGTPFNNFGLCSIVQAVPSSRGFDVVLGVGGVSLPVGPSFISLNIKYMV